MVADTRTAALSALPVLRSSDALPAAPELAARRCRSLPFSPLDGAGSGPQRRLPLTPLPQNRLANGAGASGHALKSDVVHLEESALAAMDVWSMRQLIRTAGLKHADCGDIHALRERVRQALAGERQSETDANEEEEEQPLPQFYNEHGSLELRRTSMRSSMDGLQPAGHRRARVSAPTATPCDRRCSSESSSGSSSGSSSDEDDRENVAERGERATKRARISPQRRAEVATRSTQPASTHTNEEDTISTHERLQLLEATASAARYQHDPDVIADVLSPRMQYRLTCCAEEVQLEVECSAEDVDWRVAVDAKAATATLLNAVYLSEFIPTRIVDRLSWNVGLLHQFVQGYTQCFQAILYLLKQQCVPPTPER